MAQMTMVQAINDALKSELKRDEDVLVFGEDVGVNGGVFRVTEGLQKEFGEDRVFDTPLAESGIGGLALGLAVTGYRPVMEIQFLGFVFEVFDEVAGQIAVGNEQRGFGLGHADRRLHDDAGQTHAADRRPEQLTIRVIR